MEVFLWVDGVEHLVNRSLVYLLRPKSLCHLASSPFVEAYLLQGKAPGKTLLIKKSLALELAHHTGLLLGVELPSL